MTVSARSAVTRRDAEDGYAIVVGAILIVLGLMLLKAAGLVTGGMAGVALIVARAVPLPAGLLFAVLNLPFLLLAGRSMGLRFTARTVMAGVAIAGLSAIGRDAVAISHVEPLFAALVGGTVIGMGSLALLRHRTGVGGVGILCLWLERRLGWKVGLTTFGFDLAVLTVSAPLLTPWQLLCSALSAAAASGIVLTWHRIRMMA